jgi:hypothetical protein
MRRCSHLYFEFKAGLPEGEWVVSDPNDLVAWVTTWALPKQEPPYSLSIRALREHWSLDTPFALPPQDTSAQAQPSPTSAKLRQQLAVLLGTSAHQAAVPAATNDEDTLRQRYKELNDRLYANQLSDEERKTLRDIEEQLDELDETDAELIAATQRIEQGYDHLDEGLAKINRILDNLLAH